MNNEKKYFLNVLKSIGHSLLITVPVYFIVLMSNLLVFFGDGESEASIILPKLIAIAVYFAVLYLVHIKQSAEFSKTKVKNEYNWNKIAQDTHFIYQKAICETMAERQRKQLEQEKAEKIKKSKGNEMSKLIPFNRKNQAYA